MRGPKRPFVHSSVLSFVLLAGASGCQGTTTSTVEPRDPSAIDALPPAAVTDGSFAAAVHRLLRESKATPERSALLAGTVRRQLEHAAVRFASGDDQRGTRAVLGALYLLRTGEARPDMLDRSSLTALSGAIERFSARGDEGRALALMNMKRGLLAAGSAEARALDEHIAALQQWMKDTRTGGPMEILSADGRAAVARALVDPSEEALAAAAKAVSQWIDQAVEINLVFQETRQLPPREEAIAAFRALQDGAYLMAAIFLRHGRATGALDAIESSAAGRVTRPSFFARLQAVAVDDGAEEWRMLAREFARSNFDDDAPQLEPEVLDAALWGVALEAYRRDPSSLAVAHMVAGHLVDYGMPEVAPLVLGDALGREPAAAGLSGALDLVVDALSVEYGTGDLATARRIFAASRRLLEIGDDGRYGGKLRTSAAQVRQVMASIELASGNVDAARPLLVAALRAEPTVWGYTMLGTLERQVGNLDAALMHAEKAVSLPAARVPHLDAASAKLLTFEILRDRGAIDRARQALDEALEIVLASRKQGATAEHAVRAERMLARVLDGYGDRTRAARAIERALDIADTHRTILAPTMLAAIGRALVYKDVGAARSALGVGIRADLDSESLTYGAVWLMLLERELGERPDGKVDRILVEALNGHGWSAKLARWARGSLSDADLRSAARSYRERIEAEFYIAMNARVSGKGDSAEKLRSVAGNPLVEEIEVRIARDLLAPQLHVQLPEKVVLP